MSRYNRVTNPSFETDIAGTWVGVNTEECYETSVDHARMWSSAEGGPGIGDGVNLCYASVSPGQPYFGVIQSNGFDVTPGEYITATALVAHSAEVEGGVKLEIFFYDEYGDASDSRSTSRMDAPTFAGAQPIIRVQVPDGLVAARVRISAWQLSATTASMWVDNVVACTGTTQAEADAAAIGWWDRPRLGTPGASLGLELVTGYQAAYPTRATIHDVIDRPDPIVTRGVTGTRRGTLTYWCSTHAAALEILDLYAFRAQLIIPGELVLDHVAVDSPSITPHQLQPGLPTRWQLTIPYVEVTT